MKFWLFVAVQAFYCYSAVSRKLKLIGMFDMFALLAVVIYKKVSSMWSEVRHFHWIKFLFFSSALRVSSRQQNKAVSSDFSKSSRFLKHDLLHSMSWLNSKWVVKLSMSHHFPTYSRTIVFSLILGWRCIFKSQSGLNIGTCLFLFSSGWSLADGPAWSEDSQTLRVRVNRLYTLILSSCKKVVAECDFRL